MITTTQQDYQIKKFASSEEWRDWLEKNHATVNGVWIQFFKKSSGINALNYDGALDEALCYGWIDGQTKKYDDDSWIQKFTPRRPKSMWSKRNIGITERLIKEGKMRQAGQEAIEAAKADGRWQEAYDRPSEMKVPEDFLKELAKNKKAEAVFNNLSKTNRYAIAWKLQTAKKPETRERRMKVILEMLEKGEKVY